MQTQILDARYARNFAEAVVDLRDVTGQSVGGDDGLADTVIHLSEIAREHITTTGYIAVYGLTAMRAAKIAQLARDAGELVTTRINGAVTRAEFLEGGGLLLHLNTATGDGRETITVPT